MSVLENLQMGAFQRTDRANFQEDMDRVFDLFPRLAERKQQQAGTDVGRRAADVRDRAGADGAAEAAHARRAVDGAGADLRREDLRDRGRDQRARTPILLVEQNALMALDAASRGYVMETGVIALEGRPRISERREGAQDLPGRRLSEPARPAPPRPRPRLVPLQHRRAAATVPVLATVFLCGGVLLGVEMAASHVLRPTSATRSSSGRRSSASSSAGSRPATGSAAPRRPLSLAADARRVTDQPRAVTAAIPLLDQVVIDDVLRWDRRPARPVLCTAILFLPMAVLLSAVGRSRAPADARPAARRTAGRTFAISTAGSIVGTFATAFWLIPRVRRRAAVRPRRGRALRHRGLVELAGGLPAVVAAACALSVAASLYAISLGAQRIEPLTATSASWSPLAARGYGYLDARDPRAVVEARI